MSTYRTAEEVKEGHVAALGSNLGLLYNHLSDECTWLHMKWREYSELFGTSPERLDVLNAAAGSFFRIVQDVMWDDALLGLARLTDPERTGKYENLSIQALPKYLTDPLLSLVESDIESAVKATGFARDWRNRRIAHTDLGLALGGGSAKPLEHASRISVNDALAAIASVLNRIDQHYFDSTVMYSMSEAAPPSSVSMLRRLRDGLEQEERRRERLWTGKLEPGDVEPERPI